MELFIYYALPNIVLFGSIYCVGKIAERSVWYAIENHDQLTK